MANRAPDFERFQKLVDYSPEVDAQYRICLIVEGESDAVSANAADPLATQSNFEFHLNRWLDALKGLYGFNTFAIVNIGRRGTSQGEVDGNASGVTIVRDAYDAVIAARADCYDVYPHLNNTTFVLDNLTVDGSGYWTGGQANNADGIHYTTAQYETMGRTAAFNLWTALGGP